MASPYKIHLDTYDGPLDLLLDLIKKQEIDIHNIPIAKITGQYLEYLHKLEQLDMDISADFIYMAATLIYIKSKCSCRPIPWPARKKRKTRAPTSCSASWSTKNSRAPRNSCTSANRLKSTSGRSRTCRCMRAKRPKA